MESQLEFPQSAILTPYNYFEWKPKIQLHLRIRGLFRITMETEVEPTSAIEKSRYFNSIDEAFGILCLSISPELLFHVESCSTPNEVWKILERLFGKQDEIWQSFLFSLGHTNEERSVKFDEDISHAPVDEADSASADTEETRSLTDDQDSNLSPATGGKSVSSYASSLLADQAELERKGSGISVISSENIRSTSCNEEKSYKKPSTYRPVDCSTRLCKSYEYSACYMCSGPRAPSCNNHSCSVPEPGFQLGQDEAALFRSDSRHYPVLRLPSACAEQGNPSDLLPGMDGVARVTSSTLALPAQFSAAWRLSRKFGMCLSQEGSILDGHLFFGDSPLVFSPLNGGHARDLSRHLTSTATVFERLVKEVCPRTIVELGTFLGASALHMAALALDLGLHTQILCVDDFRGWPGFRQNFRGIQILNGDVMLFYQFMQNVASMNSTDTVVSVPYSTAGALKVLCEWGIYEDLIEVDAAHDFHSAWADINAAYAILRPGGVMFGHDYYTMMDNRGVRSAINLFAKLRNLRVEPFFTGHLELPEELKLTLQEVFFQKYFKSRSLDSCEIG